MIRLGKSVLETGSPKIQESGDIVSNQELVLKLFLQLFFILITCRFVTYIGKRYFGQTSVVCEMIAGIILGPSLLGLLFPEFQGWLFPKTPLIVDGKNIPNPSMSILFSLSQVGLVLYMFMVGTDFNTRLIKQRAKAAFVVSSTGIIVPFFLGGLVAIVASDYFDFFSSHVSTVIKAAYLGIVLSITAFPMLARILEETQSTKTSFATLSLAAGSMDDVCAWIMFALLLTSITGKTEIVLITFVGAFLFAVFMVLMKRPLQAIQSLLSHVPPAKRWEFAQPFTAILIILMLCAWFTDFIGIYSVFGAFVLGIIMPRGAFIEHVRIRMNHLTTSFLLPIFFVFSGLSTQIGLVNTVQLWSITVIILLVAILGKGVTCMLAARAMGDSWRDSATIGALMNARGLMELIILNIGLQENIITPTLFTILVIMAVITTLMASPFYYFFQGKKRMPVKI